MLPRAGRGARARLQSAPVTLLVLSACVPDEPNAVLAYVRGADGYTVSAREIPALTELRKVCIELLRQEQVAGTVRRDIDPVAVGNGVVAITLSLLMSVVQLGPQSITAYAPDVAEVFKAALHAPRQRKR